MCLKCKYCGNDKKFYHEVAVLAKQAVDPRTLDDIGQPHGVDINELCNEYEPIYCGICQRTVEDTE